MDVAQSLIFITSYYFKFLVINDSVFKLMMVTESGIRLKNTLAVIYTKILHYSFVLTIYEKFKTVFVTYLVET